MLEAITAVLIGKSYSEKKKPIISHGGLWSFRMKFDFSKTGTFPDFLILHRSTSNKYCQLNKSLQFLFHMIAKSLLQMKRVFGEIFLQRSQLSTCLLGRPMDKLLSLGAKIAIVLEPQEHVNHIGCRPGG